MRLYGMISVTKIRLIFESAKFEHKKAPNLSGQDA